MSLKKKVLLVGNCVLDFITENQEYPQEDAKVGCIRSYWQRGGKASNASTVLSLLGASVEFFGMISRIEAFRILIEDFRKHDISIEHCPKTNVDAIFGSVILSKKTGSRTVVSCNKDFPAPTFEQFQCIDLNNYGWVHFEAVNTAETIKMMRHVREHNVGRRDKILISLDLEVNINYSIILTGFSDYIVLSKDCAKSFGWNTAKESCYGLRDKIFPRRDINMFIPNIVCLWDCRGVGVLDTIGVFKLCPHFAPEKIIDSLGAANCFMGAFIYALYWKDRKLVEAVAFGIRAAEAKFVATGYSAVAHLSKLL